MLHLICFEFRLQIRVSCGLGCACEVMTSLASALVASRLSLGDLYGGHVPLAAKCWKSQHPQTCNVHHATEKLRHNINSTYQSRLGTSQLRWISAMHTIFFVFAKLCENQRRSKLWLTVRTFPEPTNQISHPAATLVEVNNVNWRGTFK